MTSERVSDERPRDAALRHSGGVVKPRLTDAAIRAACKAHFGTDNIDGVCVTVRGKDWTFRDAFKRMWHGAWSALSPVPGEPVAWIETRTIGLDWTEKVLVSNPEYRENNGPQNFTPLYASPPEPVEVTEEMVERVFNAAWDCPHEITGSAVTLRADPTKPGNALSQLHQRLTDALKRGGE